MSKLSMSRGSALRERLLSLLLAISAFAPQLHAQSVGPAAVMFTNVYVFDGKTPELKGPQNVLVRGNRIDQIASTTDPASVPGVTVVDGGARTLMPGLIDMHWHTMLVRPTAAQALSADVGYTTLVAGAEATATLMRGFTTVRDMGGPAFGLKRAIDEGVLPGPRIYPSGAMISVTGGHGDFRQPFELPRTLGAPQSRGEQVGAAMIADSPDRKSTRLNSSHVEISY